MRLAPWGSKWVSSGMAAIVGRDRDASRGEKLTVRLLYGTTSPAGTNRASRLPARRRSSHEGVAVTAVAVPDDIILPARKSGLGSVKQIRSNLRLHGPLDHALAWAGKIGTFGKGR